MVDVARVMMFGMPVGTFRWDGRYEVVRFEYDNSFVTRGLEPSPLMMPVRERRVYSFAALNKDTYQGLPGMLADSLPDTYGRALFDKWLALTATHQMSVNGKFDEITRKDLLVLAEANNIKGAETVIDEVCEAAAHWEQIAQECGVPQKKVKAIEPNMMFNL